MRFVRILCRKMRFLDVLPFRKRPIKRVQGIIRAFKIHVISCHSFSHVCESNDQTKCLRRGQRWVSGEEIQTKALKPDNIVLRLGYTLMTWASPFLPLIRENRRMHHAILSVVQLSREFNLIMETACGLISGSSKGRPTGLLDKFWRDSPT